MNFFEIVRKKGRNLVLINAAVLFTVLLVFYAVNQNEHYTDAFKDYYSVNSVQELEYCSTGSRYVKLNFTDFYETDMAVYDNYILTAYYVDFDIDGFGLIGIVSKNDAEDIFDGDQDYVYGKIEVFTGIYKNAMDSIIDEYVSEFGDEYGEAQIRDMYLPFQLNNYSGHKGGDYFIMILFFLVILLNLICVLKGLIMLVMPGKYLSGKRRGRFMDNAYEDDTYAYKDRGLIVTKNYLIRETLISYKIYDLEDIRWVYNQDIWLIRGTYKGTVIKTIRKQTIHVHHQNDAIYMILKEKNPSILYGDSRENKQRYREIVTDSTN